MIHDSMISVRRALLAAALAIPFAAYTAGAQHDMSGGGDGLTVRGFTDVTWLSGGHGTGRTPAFNLGQFDLFFASRIADRFTFQGETVFEFNPAANGFVVDVERIVVGYTVDDHLRVLAGKVHTPLGYWNNAYHHGLVLQPTIERPLLVHFEDDGGSLPIHTVGVQLSGRDISDAHLGFDVLLGNGLGNRPAPDTNATPSLTVALHSQLTTSFRVGVSAYRVHAVAGTNDRRGGQLAAPMVQTIGGGFATYLTDRAEAILEAQQVMDNSLGQTTSSPGWFAYAGWRVTPQIVPYVMHDQLRLAANDPYFLANDTRRETLGARWEQSAAVVFKLELRSIDTRGQPRASDLGAQLAVAF
jgi:hypothetical protein